VDDILLMYNDKHTDINLTLQEFNNMQPNLRFTIEKKHHNKINFLDITMQRTDNIPKTNDDGHNNSQYIMPPYTKQNVSHQLSD
jgi:hypothetical protein